MNEELIRNNLETILYEIPAGGQPRAFRWHEGILQVSDLPNLEWHDVPMRTE